MIDKFIYKFFAAIDEGFAWVDNSVEENKDVEIY